MCLTSCLADWLSTNCLLTYSIFSEHSKVEVLESSKVDSDEKFHFLESDIVQLRTALRISSEQTLLLEKKLSSAAERNAEYCRENRQLKEGTPHYLALCLLFNFVSDTMSPYCCTVF